MSSRTATTGNPSRPGSRNAGTQYNPRAANLVRLPSGSLVQLSKPVVDPREVGAGFLFLFLLLLEALIVLGAYFGYQAFVP
ncbi:hypothetical protein ACWAT4_21670 [Bradyrhizobium manausense]